MAIAYRPVIVNEKVVGFVREIHGGWVVKDLHNKTVTTMGPLKDKSALCVAKNILKED